MASATDEWAAIAHMRRTSRPATSATNDPTKLPSTTKTTRMKRVSKQHEKQLHFNSEEPQVEDAAEEEELLFRAAPPHAKRVQPKSDGTSRLTSLLGSANEKLHEQLLIASEKGKRHAVYLLLHQCGVADRDRCRGMRGFTPLHHAATRGHLDVLQLLIEFGWSVDARNDSQETPLHLASFNGHAAIVELLLDKGADGNALTSDDETPLFYAARKNHYRIVRLLIRRECDLSVKNRYGDVAQDEATSEKALLEFAVGREDLGRLYSRRTTTSTPSTSKSAGLTPSITAFRGEVTLGQKQRELVLSFLDLTSLCRASQMSYRWHRASDSPALWRHLGVSRWELLLQTTVGIGAVSPMALLAAGRGAAGRLQLNTASLVGSVGKTKNKASCPSTRRPSSCDPAAASFTSYSSSGGGGGAGDGRFPAPRERSGSLYLGDHRRPQTARLPAF